MGIPVVAGVTVVHLHEAYPRFDQSPGLQALAPVLFGGLLANAIQPVGLGAFVGQIKEAWSRSLHAEGQLEGSDPRLQPGIGTRPGQVFTVGAGQQVELQPLEIVALGGSGVRQATLAELGIAITHPGSLEGGWQES